MKIAIQLDENGNIIGVVATDEQTAERQSKLKGWTLVDSDPAFNIPESYLWTIRVDDDKLVYLSDLKTPAERTQANITELTKGNLNNQMTGVQLQTAITALTKSNLQLNLDNAQLKSDSATQQKAITSLTSQMLDLQMKSITPDTSVSTTNADTTK